MCHGGPSVEIDSFSTEQPYRFIGNELYSGSGLGLYDFKARLYDPALGRFLSVDPMAEKYAPFGTYGYCIGNPVRFLDDGGEDIVLFGKNNSSVTIRTDLIDFSVNVGTLGIDWRGNHILAGQETLSAALDLAGWVDPTGMADGANAILQASQKDYWGALQSSIALLPLGDVVKVGRIGKDINILSNAVGIATHKHHLIPKAVYRNNEGVFKGLLKRDSAENLIELPAGFHGNHPEYNKWIQNKITEKTTKGHTLSKDDLNKIMSKAQKEIKKAYDLFNGGSDKNLNKYFKSLNNLPN